MKSEDIVALVHDGETICGKCLCTSAENAVWTDTDAAGDMMSEQNITVIHKQDLKGNEKCGRCGKKIR